MKTHIYMCIHTYVKKSNIYLKDIPKKFTCSLSPNFTNRLNNFKTHIGLKIFHYQCHDSLDQPTIMWNL